MSNKPIKNEDKLSNLKYLSRKLNEAVIILHAKEYKDNQIIKIVTQKFNGLKLSVPLFSKYKNAYKENSTYAQSKSINLPTFEKIFKVVDDLISDELNLVWDLNNDKYILKATVNESEAAENLPIIDLNKNESFKLNGLKGVWKGFSWNKRRTERDKEGHINIFKIKIYDKDNVVCTTEKAKFNGKMKVVSKNRINFDFSATDRKLYMFGKIGLRESLYELKGINIAYSDTGDEEVKCGLAVLQKVDEKYENIVVQSFKISEIELQSQIINYLKDTQHIAYIYD